MRLIPATKHAMPVKPALLTASAALALLALSGCVPNSPASAGDGAAAGAITVDSSADACTVSASSATSGTLTFSVTNSGDQVTEFYLLADDGLRIVGEVENVGPGISRDLVVQAQPGDYFTVCKPGMVGDGIGKAAFTVSGDKVELAGDLQDQVDAAALNYVAYVKDQVAQLRCLPGGRRPEGPRPLRHHPRELRAHRARRRVVRRPRPGHRLP